MDVYYVHQGGMYSRLFMYCTIKYHTVSLEIQLLCVTRDMLGGGSCYVCYTGI